MKKVLYKLGLTKKLTRTKLDEFIKKYANRGKTLDIGCGGSPYKKYFPNRVSIDIEKKESVDIVADAHNLDMFEDETFDCIICTEVLEHLHTPQIAIDEMRRVLKNNGQLILTTRFLFPLHDTPNDYYRFTKYGLKHLLKNFEILELKEETNTIGALAVLYQRIGFQTETLSFKPFKLCWLIKARLINLFSFIISKEYGDIKHKKPEKNIMTSGYYVACKK